MIFSWSSWCCKWQYFIYYDWVIFHCIYHILSQSSVGGHLGCFHVLVIVNNAVMNIGVHILHPYAITFHFSIFSFVRKIPSSESTGSYCGYIFNFFEKTPYCFPQWLHQFTFPPTVHKDSLFSTSSTAFVITCLFDDSHSDRYEVISHCSFAFHFPHDWAPFHVLNFMYMLAICISSLENCFLINVGAL